MLLKSQSISCFNTQPPEGGWRQDGYKVLADFVSTHSRPKAAVGGGRKNRGVQWVSTHSRPKAAGLCRNRPSHLACFNTQPPEGGWFNQKVRFRNLLVSTHSRPKAAAQTNRYAIY